MAKPRSSIIFLIFTVLLSYGLYSLGRDIRDTVQKLRKRVPELVASHGYPIQEHFLTTSDDYVLCIHRIPHGKLDGTINPVPILLGHGSSMGSSGFLVGDPEDYLGYVLADHGYDVWLINNRGNSYSKNSTLHDTSSKPFWDFGFEEMALLDYPQVIDYIINITGEKSIFFLGTSQGASQFLGLLSDLPDYNSKIRGGVLLAPAIYVNSSTAIPFKYSRGGDLYQFISETIFESYEAWLAKDFLMWAAHRLCSPNGHLHTYCPLLGTILYGEAYLDYDILHHYADHIFHGSSYRSYSHFAQWHRSGLFHKYDFGSEDINGGKVWSPRASYIRFE
ncbi:LIPA [Lepeophtheirus salmonis]|uniref:LIPA n=1 Tax=Lepeophtheirus salmonis TaxID=72036 RepID=A0A7R8CQK6_LEPSM|nr:LIPA [Lepeophtheirus salmonis]CAF2860092.1 LIPA [Lepeophtheirus salmonis]